ncbi:hypothetical protein K469DRAFT_545254 [Zopfia rhizophila CBS 207.26]|uniref:Uncharacterized protein n=1 Tax=Zopfia rhizophila CBS 207.26 TaxID=1314779 RepID=A0A6A6EXI0_9PEZI|nr:hypothetical protein K469DRAFT_545254 [Zopfia rhizophila CBS 207.26]
MFAFRDNGPDAVKAGFDIAERLLASEVNISARFLRYAVQAAAGGGHVEVVDKLLAVKADVNAAPANAGGRTALQAAAGGGHVEIAEILRRAGAV